MNINYKLFVLLTVFFLDAMSSYSQEGFTLNGTFDQIRDGTKIHLVQYSSSDTVASTIIRQNGFQFKGVIPNETEYYFLRIDDVKANKRGALLLLVNGKMTLKSKFKEWPKVNLQGSNPYDEYRAAAELWRKWQGTLEKLDERQRFLIAKTEEEKDSIKAKPLQVEVTQLKKEKDRAKGTQLQEMKSYIYAHLGSAYIPDLIYKLQREIPLEERMNMYHKLSDKAKKSFFGIQLKEDLEFANKRKEVKQGTVIPNFSVTSSEGNKISVHEVAKQHKLTLIDFWASWCGPCRAEIPNLKRVYSAFKDKGFNVLGIAISDKENNWKKALAEDGATWIHGWDKDGMASQIFDLPTIPGYALLDANGKLIAYACPGSPVKAFGPQIKGDGLYDTIKQLLSN